MSIILINNFNIDLQGRDMSVKKSVLIIDDSQLTRMIIIKIINTYFECWNITEAINACQAIEKAKISTFDFIFLDHNMPDMTGYEILPELNKLQPLSKIGIFTANVQSIVRKRFEALGATFHNKPINEQVVLEFLKTNNHDHYTNAFTKRHCDTLGELFNIGMGRAASSLSDMVDSEVILTIPSFNAVDFHSALSILNSESTGNVNAVEQCFQGEFSGNAFLFFNNESSLELIHSILGEEGWSFELGEMEQEALKEISNIILNACFGCIADILECELESSVPELISGKVDDVFDVQRMHVGTDPLVLTLSMTFSLPNKNITGQVSLIMASESIQRLIVELERFIKQSV